MNSISMAEQNRWETATGWLLRCMGAVICLSIVPAFMPLEWHRWAHNWLGLGEAPRQVIFEYMARTMSAMYFAHGCVLLAVATDVRRYKPLVRLLAGLNVAAGGVFTWIDLRAGMPAYWTWLEGPPIAAVGLVLLALASRIPDAPST